MVKEDAVPTLSFLQEFSLNGQAPTNKEVPQGFSHIIRVNAWKPAGNHPLGSRMFTLTTDGRPVQEVVQELMAGEVLIFAEPNFTRKVSTIPTDPLVATQWYHDRIQTFGGWETTRGNSSVVVGILDTGLEYAHPEFAGQIYINAPEDINGNGKPDYWPNTVISGGVSGDFDGLDNDGNGVVDDVSGYDFTDQPRSPYGGDYLGPDGDPTDENGHGTLVAGIIGARADNGFGGTGIAPDCKLIPIRCFSANGSGEDDDIARAIIYAADNGIRILNFSFGDVYPSLTMQTAIRYAYSKGVIMIASAGNGTGDTPHYPSNFDEVISVAATAYDSTGNRDYLWPFSGYGSGLTISAPGSNIFCPTLIDSIENIYFGTFSGTSTSAPMVTAAVALLVSAQGWYSPEQVRGMLATTARDISDEGWDHLTGAGILDIGKLLAISTANDIKIESPVNGGGSSASSVIIVGSAIHPEFRTWTLEWQPGIEGGDSWNSIMADVPYQVLHDTLASWNLAGVPDGVHTLRLRVAINSGASIEDRIQFTVDRSAPTIEIFTEAPCWDNEHTGFLVTGRASDLCTNYLYISPVSVFDWQKITSDRITKGFSFFVAPEMLSSALNWMWYVVSVNAAGGRDSTSIHFFTWNPEAVASVPMNQTGLSAPMGVFLPGTYDLDSDGLPEVVASRLDEALSFGRLVVWENNGGILTQVDSIAFKPTLIPKDIKDTDGDGRMEILCSVLDSVYIIETVTPGGKFADGAITFRSERQGYFPTIWADPDLDTQFELIMKDFRQYYIFESGGGTYTRTHTLTDTTTDFFGSTAPKVLTGDFDLDGRQEIVYGDYDGDLLIYEFDGSGYVLTYGNSTSFNKSSDYLTSGDFNGNGRPEIFIATHTATIRNDDNEYETPYWQLRILESTADNTFSIIWQDFLYDMDGESYNSSITLNADADSRPELLFHTFPRTYIFDFDGTDYRPIWFQYGSLARSLATGDLNANGIQDFGLGRGDSTFWYEPDVTFTGPLAAGSLDGTVMGPDSISISWLAVSNATYYRIWRGVYTGGSTAISLIDSTAALSFVDNGLVSDTTYLYVIQTANPGLSPAYGDFSYQVLLTPHPRIRLDSAIATTAGIVKLFFSGAVSSAEQPPAYFTIDGNVFPNHVTGGEGGSANLILGLNPPLSAGNHTITVNALFRDAQMGLLSPGGNTVAFTYTPDTTKYLYITRHQVLNPQEAIIWFNTPVGNSALNANNYRLSPIGQVSGVEFANTQQTGVKIALKGAAIGALGYPLQVTLNNITALNGVSFPDREGNTVVFSSYAEDLSDVFTYPNPVLKDLWFEGMRFANLTRTATIRIFTVSGQLVTTLEETDGDGGYTWNMAGSNGERIAPGVYLYHVTAPDVEDFLGKFAVLE